MSTADKECNIGLLVICAVPLVAVLLTQLVRLFRWLGSIIDENDYRFVDYPLAKAEAIKLMIPKLRGKTAQIILKNVLREVEKKITTSTITNAEAFTSTITNAEAFIKVVGIDVYKENDNPPMEVLKQIASAIKTGFFSTLFVAFPMIGRTKQVDPIVFGVVSKRDKKMWGMDTVELLRFNQEVSVEDLKTLDNGKMFRIAEWV